MQSSDDESEYSDTDSEGSSENDWNDGEFVRTAIFRPPWKKPVTDVAGVKISLVLSPVSVRLCHS